MKNSRLMNGVLSAVLAFAPFYSSGCNSPLKINISYRGQAIKERIVQENENIGVYVQDFKNYVGDKIVTMRIPAAPSTVIGALVKAGDGKGADAVSIKVDELRTREEGEARKFVRDAFISELKNAGCEILESASNLEASVGGEILKLKVTSYTIGGAMRSEAKINVQVCKGNEKLYEKVFEEGKGLNLLDAAKDKDYWVNNENSPIRIDNMLASSLEKLLKKAVPEIVAELRKAKVIYVTTHPATISMKN